MGKSPSSGRRRIAKSSACCLLAPKDLACQLEKLMILELLSLPLETVLIFGYNISCIFVFTGGFA